MIVAQSKSRPPSGGSAATSALPPRKIAMGSMSRTESLRNVSWNPGLGPSPYSGQRPTASKIRRTMKPSAISPLRPVVTVGAPPTSAPSELSSHSRKQAANGGSRPDAAGRQSAGVLKPRRRFVVGVMPHCGSIYEELTRQLIATGRWTAVAVKQRAAVKTLYVDETRQDISDVNIHLLLGDKPSCERVIATRRAMHMRLHHGPAKANLYSTGPRVPMGNGDDGELRVIDFVENTRCITLKSAMVTTLLRYHNNDWAELGQYLPMTFKILPGKPGDDDRRRLMEISLSFTSEAAPLWIAKSSSGCHGDNIEIFRGDRAGLQRMFAYIDNRSRTQPWVAQQYVDRPLLYHKRKFDIRCMALYLRDTDEIFVHEDIVMRMSSVAYDRDSATGTSKEAKLAHITNHCIQETGKAYSAFEEGNELWKEHLDGLIRYKADRLPAARRKELLRTAASVRSSSRTSGVGGASYSLSPGRAPRAADMSACSNGGGGESSANSSGVAGPTSGITLRNAIMPQIHRIVVDTILAAMPNLPVEPKPLPTHCFQILGYDFLIDESLRVWLLEINGAPGGPTRLVPKIMADTIELAINPFFPCSLDRTGKSERNGYTRVFPE